MNQLFQKVDVVVIGAGIAGATLSCILAASGLRVVILEAGQMPKRDANRYDLRVSALNLASKNTLIALGVWSQVETIRAYPFHDIEVWDQNSPGRVLFRASDAGLQNLGHIVENSAVILALHEKLSKEEVEIHYDLTVDKLYHNDKDIIVSTTDGLQFRAKLLVGADGTSSRVRELTDITIDQSSYSQDAIVAQVTTQKSNKQTAYQRFLSTGPLAFLPITDKVSSIVWSTDRRTSDHLIKLPDDKFKRELETAYQNRLGSIASISRRERFSVSSRHAKTYIGPRVALIGDAAHTVHPLAGLGANQGIIDAAALAELVAHSMNHNIDFGNRLTLRRYERWRKTENQLILNSLDGLFYWFQSQNKTIRLSRSLGLNLTNNIKPIRMVFLKRAVGLTGELPTIAKSPSIH